MKHRSSRGPAGLSIALAAAVIAVVGCEGPAGPRGPAGSQGDAGPQGDEGHDGLQGSPGPRGDAGPKGDRGSDGMQGAPGPRGDAGPQGEQGSDGMQGAAGPRGDAGPQGDAGRDAASCVVAVGDDIQDCIDDVVSRGGGTVLVLAGKHELTHFVHIAGSNVILRGEGTSTRLVLLDGVNASPILVGRDPASVNPDEGSSEEPLRDIEIRDIYIDANRAGQSGEAWAQRPHINISGITVRYAEHVSIRDVVVTSAPSAGILVEKSSTDFSLDGVEVRDSAFDGFSCNKSSEGRVVDSTFTENGAAGITATCDCSRNIISNNVIARNGTGPVKAPGIYLAQANDNLVSANLIFDNGDTGVTLVGDDCLVPMSGASTNYFAANRITGNGSCGIYLDPLKGGPGTGNAAVGTFYSLNAVNGVCSNPPEANQSSQLFLDRDPVIP